MARVGSDLNVEEQIFCDYSFKSRRIFSLRHIKRPAADDTAKQTLQVRRIAGKTAISSAIVGGSAASIIGIVAVGGSATGAISAAGAAGAGVDAVTGGVVGSGIGLITGGGRRGHWRLGGFDVGADQYWHGPAMGRAAGSVAVRMPISANR